MTRYYTYHFYAKLINCNTALLHHYTPTVKSPFTTFIFFNAVRCPGFRWCYMRQQAKLEWCLLLPTCHLQCILSSTVPTCHLQCNLSSAWVWVALFEHMNYTSHWCCITCSDITLSVLHRVQYTTAEGNALLCSSLESASYESSINTLSLNSL